GNATRTQPRPASRVLKTGNRCSRVVGRVLRSSFRGKRRGLCVPAAVAPRLRPAVNRVFLQAVVQRLQADAERGRSAFLLAIEVVKRCEDQRTFRFCDRSTHTNGKEWQLRVA